LKKEERSPAIGGGWEGKGPTRVKGLVEKEEELFKREKQLRRKAQGEFRVVGGGGKKEGNLLP